MTDQEILGAAMAYTNKHGGGGSGTTNYNELENKPQIAGTELQGNKSLADLGIASASALANKVDKVEGKGLSTNDYDDTEKQKNANNATAITGIKNGTTINDFAGVETALDDVETVLATKQDATDNNLDTDAKTIVGAINEHEGDIGSLKSGLTNLDNEVNGDATTYPYADVITINDAVPANLADCSVKVEPVQDLHGYDKPWVGGAYKNKAYVNINPGETSLTEIKDSDNNVIGVNAIVASAGVVITIKIATVSIENGKTYTLSGSPDGKGNSSYRLDVRTQMQGQLYNNWNEVDNPTITATEDVTLDVYLRIAANYGVDNIVFHPQIEEGSTATTFAPYTNICPISGHTEAVVTRDGKNLAFFNSFAEKTTEGVKFTYINPTLIHIKRTAQSANTVFLYSSFDNLQRIVLNAGTYSVSCNMPSGSTNGFMRLFKYVNGSPVVFIDTIRDDGIARYFTLTERTEFIMQVQITAAQTNIDMDVWMQIESGSTATPYEPYAGQQYTLALGDTIYGGTVDFDSGVMTVDRAKYTITTLIRNNDHSFFKRPDITAKGNQLYSVISDKLKPGDNSELDAIFTDADGVLIVQTSSAYSSGADAISGLGGSVDAVYELATPFTVQLTPQQIQLLQGTNTLYASTGDISVTVNGVSGSIGALQEQVNELAEEVAEIKPVDYSTTEQKTGQKWIDGKDIYFNTFELTEPIEISNSAWTSLGISATGIDTLINAVLHFPPTGIRNTEVRVDGGVVKAIASRTGTFEVSCVILYYTKATT